MRKQKYVERLLFTRQFLLRIVLIVKFTEINITEEKCLYYFLAWFRRRKHTWDYEDRYDTSAAARFRENFSEPLYSTHSLTHTRLLTSSIMFCSYRAYHDWHHIVHYRNARLACDCTQLIVCNCKHIDWSQQWLRRASHSLQCRPPSPSTRFALIMYIENKRLMPLIDSCSWLIF